MKVKFLKSPTGIYNLAYSIGQTAELNLVLAKELIAAGVAEEVPTEKVVAKKPVKKVVAKKKK